MNWSMLAFLVFLIIYSVLNHLLATMQPVAIERRCIIIHRWLCVAMEFLLPRRFHGILVTVEFSFLWNSLVSVEFSFLWNSCFCGILVSVEFLFPWNSRFHGILVSVEFLFPRNSSSFRGILISMETVVRIVARSYTVVAFALHLVIMMPMSAKFALA